MKLVIIPNEAFSGYIPQYGVQHMEQYFNPNSVADEVHIVSPADNYKYKTTRFGTLVIHPIRNFMHLEIPMIYLPGLLKTIEVIKKYDIDIVRAYNCFQLGLVGALAAKITKRPFVLSLHGDYDNMLKQKGKFAYYKWHSIEKFNIKSATKVIAISDYLVDYAKKHGAKDVAKIPNPIPVNSYIKPDMEKVKRIKEKYPIEGRIVMLFVGRYRAPVKNFERLLLAYSQIPRELKEKSVLFVLGSGTNKEIYFKNLVKKLGLQENIIFVGFIPHDEVMSFYHVANFFVLPSISEGLGNALIEAMASGLPALTSTHPVTSSLVDSTNGVVVDPYSVEEIRDGLEKLMRMSAEERKMLGKKSIKKAATFDENVIYKQLASLYEEIGKRWNI